MHEALIVSGYVLEFGGQAAEIGRRQSAPVYTPGSLRPVRNLIGLGSLTGEGVCM